MRRRALGLLLGACACGGGESSVGVFGDGGNGDEATSAHATEGGDADDGPTDTSASASATGPGSADDTGGPIFDVGGQATGGPIDCEIEGGCGCTAVDILFVIDNSTSMGSYQEGLAAAAPAFADAIFASLPEGTDLHVGVTTSSFYGNGGSSPGEQNCSPNYEGAGLTGRDDFYDYYWTPDAMPYDENGGQGRLRVHDGLTFFATTTDADPAPLEDWLVGNITAVGESGSVFEMVAAGAAYPFHPANAAHNAGFLRDEGAVLVIFALTDEVDNSPEEVAVYHDMIAGAKQACGGDQCIVTAGVMQPCLATAPDNVLHPLLASFGEDPPIADVGPELDDCFDDCADGDITECDAVNPPVSCEGLAQGEGTAQYAEALGGALAGVIAQTCASIPPAG